MKYVLFQELKEASQEVAKEEAIKEPRRRRRERSRMITCVNDAFYHDLITFC